jgi:hypothetical protein
LFAVESRKVKVKSVLRGSHPYTGRVATRTSSTIDLVEIVTSQQIAHEGFNDGIHFPLGTIFIAQQILNAAPGSGTVILATLSLVKEFAMLLADILFVLPAIPDLHLPLPANFLTW